MSLQPRGSFAAGCAAGAAGFTVAVAAGGVAADAMSGKDASSADRAIQMRMDIPPGKLPKYRFGGLPGGRRSSHRLLALVGRDIRREGDGPDVALPVIPAHEAREILLRLLRRARIHHLDGAIAVEVQ